MAFVWRYENAAGDVKDTEQTPEEFGTQSDAESWIGEHWRELLDANVDQVSLLEDGTVVYGPMSLHPAE